ncbi:hypothetical protein C9J48_26670 [Photobacterium profundum]|uniref:Uncharacterized protein n=1 Tax=Photobacterium profundum 3TCK TaxID=314280 RepID=Q1YYI3_9GAMM|nr:hypothetical protein [Photobacterium profundum]EAS41339.1 hypothetical protein P3TCK_07444 [Photobacterium profundum 3TCK]PSV57560.1 hypothetical protein C9J48_26670 [Photobacterium profundum]
MRAIRIIYVVIAALVALSSAFAIWIYYIKEGKDLLNFTISIVGFCIAVLALFIAVRTYTSIDSVNNISKMDGNILDNENYVISVPELVRRFQCHDEKTLEKELFKSIELKLKRESDTAVLFADTLQYMVDLIVFFPAVFNASDIDKEAYRKRMGSILSEMERRRGILHAVSKGNSIQITETIKLFKSVISYQSFVADKSFNIHADLLHVKGPILRNPVTKTIYHNYLGLYYNKKGMFLINESLGLKGIDALSIEGVKLVRKKIGLMSPSNKEDAIMYFKSACEQFERAHLACGDDIMWPGFIDYNKARTLFFLLLLTNEENEWLEVMNNAIEARSRLNRMIDEVLTVHSSEKQQVNNTHLRKFFMYQEELARMVKLNILLGTASSYSDVSSLVVYRGSYLTGRSTEELKSLLQPIHGFSVAKKYQNELALHFGSNRYCTELTKTSS